MVTHGMLTLASHVSVTQAMLTALSNHVAPATVTYLLSSQKENVVASVQVCMLFVCIVLHIDKHNVVHVFRILC